MSGVDERLGKVTMGGSGDGGKRKKSPSLPHAAPLPSSLLLSPSLALSLSLNSRSPPLNDAQTVAALKEEAARLDASFRARNAASLVRLVSDTVGGATLGALLVIPSPGRTSFFGAISRVFSGLSDMAKAFLIIASTDIFLGYHSEEGWKALAHVVTSYYGIEVGEGSVYAFVAVVPVVADAFFKLYIFKGLNRTNPGSAVTLKSMKKS